MNMFKRLFCKHKNKKCLSNFHGDYIDIVSPLFSNKIYRSAWQCQDCGKIIYSTSLEPACKIVNWEILKSD